MKTQYQIEIDADRETVWKLFDDPGSLRAWQPTLESFTHKSGTPGQPDAVSELVYNENGRRVTLVETVTECREPDFLAGLYESPVGKALVVNHFTDAGPGRTRWTMYSNQQFTGIWRLLSLFLAGSIRRRNEDMMNNFKLLAESRNAGGAG